MKTLLFRFALALSSALSLLMTMPVGTATAVGVTETSTQNAPEVLAIYPRTDRVPVNILRFYVQFSRPMQEMNILQYIRLRDENGGDLSGVFYENQYELWNQERTQVTLIIDPGRVKTGLQAHQTLGRAFVAGRRYVLSIDPGLLDFYDRPVLQGFKHSFIAVAEDIQAPNTALWKHSQPQKNSREALVISFNDTLDHLSALGLIKVFQGTQEVPGHIVLEKQQQEWHFVPTRPWSEGEYHIRVSARLEDVAANSLHQVFDQKHNSQKQQQSDSHIYFRIF